MHDQPIIPTRNASVLGDTTVTAIIIAVSITIAATLRRLLATAYCIPMVVVLSDSWQTRAAPARSLTHSLTRRLFFFPWITKALFELCPASNNTY